MGLVGGMTVDESRQILVDLGSKDRYVQYQALRQLKNELIGYPAKKEGYLQQNIVSRLVHILESPDGRLQCCHEAIVIIGSLFYGTDTKASEWAGSVVPVLVQLVLYLPSAGQDAMMMARGVFETLNLAIDHVKLRQYISTPEVAQTLLELLQMATSTTTRGIGMEVQIQITGLLGSLQYNNREQECIVSDGCAMLEWLLETLWDSAERLTATTSKFDPLDIVSHTTLVYSVLQALSALCRDNVIICGNLERYRGESQLNHLLYGLVFYPSALVKLGAITLIVALYKRPTLLRSKENVKQIATVVLPILVRLLEERPSVVAEQAPFVLSYLVTDNENMQKAACDADAIKRLAAIIQQQQDKTAQPSEKLIQGVFEALAAIALFKDEYRKQIVDAGVAPHLVAAMRHPSPKVRTAACLCTRSLSRSTNLLRTALVDVEIATPLFTLLSDPFMDVKVAASAVLCNLLLDFSPLRKVCLGSFVTHANVLGNCRPWRCENHMRPCKK